MNFIKNLLTDKTFLTIVSGVLVFVLTQLYTEFCLRPMQEYKKLKGKIAKALVLYANLYSSPLKNTDINEPYAFRWKDAADETRILAAELEAFAEIKPIRLLAPSIPNRYKLKEASKSLIGLSNSFNYSGSLEELTFGENNAYEVENILGIDKLLLKIRVVKKYRKLRENIKL